MPTNIRLIRAQEFLKATAEGDYDLKESRKLLLGLASAVPAPEDVDVLIDTREVSSRLTLPSLYELAREFTDLRIAANRRTAILVPADRYEDAEFFAITAGGMGRRVSAFTSFEEVFDWLAADPSSQR
jgi:hypothetical protein